MARKLFVGNLPNGCTNGDLKALFETVGHVEECDVLKNYGFVHMGSETESQEAVTQLDKSDFLGSVIQVQFSTSSVHKTTGVGNNGECFKCGNMGHFSRDCEMNGRSGERGGRGGRGRGGRGGRGRGGGGFRGGRGGRPGGGDVDGGGFGRDYGPYPEYKVERRERDYYSDYPPRRLPPDPYYDRYYEDYYRRLPPYPYSYSSRDYPYPPYRPRSRSPPPPRRPLTPPRYRRRLDSPPPLPPPRDYYDYPDRYSESRSRYPPPPSRFSPPPRIQASAF